MRKLNGVNGIMDFYSKSKPIRAGKGKVNREFQRKSQGVSQRKNQKLRYFLVTSGSDHKRRLKRLWHRFQNQHQRRAEQPSFLHGRQ